MKYPDDVTTLHEKTKASLIDCKRALLRCDSDLEGAEELLLSGILTKAKDGSGPRVRSVSAEDQPANYPVGSRLPYNAHYRFVNVGATTNLSEASLTKVLALNQQPNEPASPSSYSIGLSDRAFGGYSQRQIFFYGTDRRLYPEYTKNATPYTGYTKGSVGASGTTVTIGAGASPDVRVIEIPKDPYAPIVTIPKTVVLDEGFYMSANSGNTNVEWIPISSASGNKHKWYAERIYRVTNIPGFWHGVEFFSAKTMSNLPPYAQDEEHVLQDGDIEKIWLYACENLYILCFGENEFYDALPLQVYGNMYGALYSSAEYAGQFHPGIDINRFDAAPVYSPVAGNVVHSGVEATGKNYGRVTIHGNDGLFYTFLHLQDDKRIALNKDVKIGDQIGKQGNRGVTASHLHFELQPTNAYSAIPVGSFTTIPSYYPYDVCFSWI